MQSTGSPTENQGGLEYHDVPPIDYYGSTTFGIELEFHLLYPIHPNHIDYVSVLEHLYHLFTNAQIRATIQGVNEARYGDSELAIVTNLMSGENRYDKWDIKLDGHDVEHEEELRVPEGYGGLPLEISSPKYDMLDVDDWEQDINKVLDVVRGLRQFGYFVFCNADTGFHVHIGSALGHIPVPVAKNVLQFVTGFERHLDLFHTVPRIKHGHTSCAPPSRFFIENTTRPDLWLDRIQHVKNFHELRDIFDVRMGVGDGRTHGHRSAYNFDFLREGNPDFKNTIEFRQHAGTLDRDEIFNWVRLVFAIMRYATVEDDVVQRVYVKHKMLQADVKLEDLFRCLQLRPDAEDFYRHKLGVTKTPQLTLTSRYADVAYEKSMSVAPPGDMWRPLLELVEGTKYNDSHILCVREAAQQKYRDGEYGDRGQSQGAHYVPQLPWAPS